ncbi:unnamed protein product [Cylicocyclus nassatus]|uniref:Uncharacterized protein n=1 Tax=Cylicocyclus nassatus TaxID=53992 RepID=A0AA36HCQ7_CYLNA|nr:unnamed protein product [Cylicocyclus nassatus]
MAVSAHTASMTQGGQSQTAECLEIGDGAILNSGYAARFGCGPNTDGQTEWILNETSAIAAWWTSAISSNVLLYGSKVLVDRVKMQAILTSKESDLSNIELRIQRLEKVLHIGRHNDDGEAMVESESETEGSDIAAGEQDDAESLSDSGDEAHSSSMDV